jgi:hypothetical protein
MNITGPVSAICHVTVRDRGLKLEVHTREGNPFKMSDLRKVGAWAATSGTPCADLPLKLTAVGYSTQPTHERL